LVLILYLFPFQLNYIKVQHGSLQNR